MVAGAGAMRALAGDRRGAVRHVIGAGGYVGLGDAVVLVAEVRAPLGPLSLLVAGLARGGLAPGDPVTLTDRELIAGRVRIALDGLRAAAPPRRAPPASGWQAVLASTVAATPRAPAELQPGIAALAAGDLDLAEVRLAGRGEGLTPAGDDVLAGYGAWRWADGAPVSLAADRCAPLGRAYLRCAERGELAEPAARVLEAIRAADADGASRRVARLSDWGATSGTALLWGMAAAAAGRSP